MKIWMIGCLFVVSSMKGDARPGEDPSTWTPVELLDPEKMEDFEEKPSPETGEISS